jgi:hypothetical protein
LKDKLSKKMTGIDVYICIDNTGQKKYLTIGKPYRVEAIIRDQFYCQHIWIKNDKSVKCWCKIELFRPRK